MTIDELVIAALAVWEVIEIWRHGSIFASWRAHVELWEGWLGQLLRCGFCLAPWVSWLLVLWLLLLARIHVAFGLIPYGFAVARLANLGNDLAHAWCRTPKDIFADVGRSDVVSNLGENHADGAEPGSDQKPTADL